MSEAMRVKASPSGPGHLYIHPNETGAMQPGQGGLWLYITTSFALLGSISDYNQWHYSSNIFYAISHYFANSLAFINEKFYTSSINQSKTKI